jgi:hypothetical protein
MTHGHLIVHDHVNDYRNEGGIRIPIPKDRFDGGCLFVEQVTGMADMQATAEEDGIEAFPELWDALENDVASAYVLYAKEYAHFWCKSIYEATHGVEATLDTNGWVVEHQWPQPNGYEDTLFITVPEKFAELLRNNVDQDKLQERSLSWFKDAVLNPVELSPVSNVTSKQWTRPISEWHIHQTAALTEAVELTFFEGCTGIPFNYPKGVEEEFLEYCAGNGKFEDFLLTARNSRINKQKESKV